MKNSRSESVGTVSRVERYVALSYGCVAHISFVFAVGVMIYALFGGLQFGYGSCMGFWRWISNALLIVQFPLFHSLLLAQAGGPMLDTLAPRRVALQLRPTTYVMVASFQLLLVFLLWSPEGRVLWVPTGIVYYVHCALYALSWLLLGKAMWDGHLGIQTGYIGWTSIWKGHRSIRWPKMPTEGLFRVCRQPIYFSFMLTLWTGPVWTIDKLCVALVWTAYCYFGPTYKEKRMSKRFGEEFAAYKERVPYWPF